MASKVLVPQPPFTKLQVKKSPEQPSPVPSISSDAAARAAHLEHSIRFLQEQHRLMLGGLHAEVEALRERNRDLQFQLIFNKESSSKMSPEVNVEENRLKEEISRLEVEAAAARGEARAAEARALQLQRSVDEQAEKLRELELKSSPPPPPEPDDGYESRAELRARLADAARLVRRLRGDAERQRREVPRAAAGVTNLLFDDAAVSAAHLHCMKSSLQASLTASGMEPHYGFHNSYNFPPLQDFWEPVRNEDYPSMVGRRGRSHRRQQALPDLTPTVAQAQRATIFVNRYARDFPSPTPRPRFDHNAQPVAAGSGEHANVPADPPVFSPCLPELNLKRTRLKDKISGSATYPELKVVVTKLDRIPLSDVAQANPEVPRPRPQRRHHRKQAADQT